MAVAYRQVGTNGIISGDILDRDIYQPRPSNKASRSRNGIIAIEIDDRLIHLVHDTREILSIVSRHR